MFILNSKARENFLQRLVLNKTLVSGTKIILDSGNITSKCTVAKVSLMPISIGRGTVLLEQSKQGEWQGGSPQIKGLR